jgi:endonuclease/exonuclease/phosphatase family metal-dependent hydrolase
MPLLEAVHYLSPGVVIEREGVPSIDEEASQTRMRQLDTMLNGIVSRYNTWRKEGYRWKKESKKATESKVIRPRTTDRHTPIWIIAGDFNFTPESLEYLAMVRRGFIDMISNHTVGTKTSGLGETPTLTVDYVFAGPRFEAIDPKLAAESADANHVEVTDDTRVSDHFPIIVSVPIELPEN